MPTKKPAKQTKSRANVKSTTTLKNKPRFNKKIALLLTVLIAGIGAYFLFFADAATNNCQAVDRVQICDVDMTVGPGDTILSVTGEAQNLGNQKWGMYFGTDFRAPTTEYNGAVPITRVYNEGATLHDWVTNSQKTAKEAKYGTLKNQGVAFFAWETQVKDTVPVYRLGRGGNAAEGSQNVYSVDKAWVDKMLADDANNPNGWKKDQFGPFIAFYAYPVNYKVADQVNPYDCSIQVNFLSDRCKMQRESLIASQTPSTPTTSTPTTKPPTTTPTPSGTSQPRTQITPTTPTISTPITPAPPQPPAPAVKYDDCPTAPSMDAGLTAYIDGVNNKKKNYSPDCHTWYLTYAKSKNDAAIGAYVTGIINGCQNEGGRWVNNACDYSVRNYLNYARWKADACFATNQAYDAPNDRCVPLPATRQFQYTCTLIGQEEISIPKRGKIWADKTISFSIFATTGGKAMDICVQFRSGLNRQDKYKEFYVPIPGGLIKN